MFNIFVALKLWANVWANKNFTIFCDNLAVVSVLNSGKTREPMLATISRNILMITSKFDIALKFCHIEGQKNRVADLLSRWEDTDVHINKLKILAPAASWMEIQQHHLYLDMEI